jgi:hypothetical protein
VSATDLSALAEAIREYHDCGSGIYVEPDVCACPPCRAAAALEAAAERSNELRACLRETMVLLELRNETPASHLVLNRARAALREEAGT